MTDDNKQPAASDLSASAGYGSKYRVSGDHPTAKRSDKSGMSFDDAYEYATELSEAGYENIWISEIPS